METLLRPVIISTSSRPAATASSTTYWIAGTSTTGSISLGIALVAGRNLVPRPAAGITALRTEAAMPSPYGHDRRRGATGQGRMAGPAAGSPGGPAARRDRRRRGGHCRHGPRAVPRGAHRGGVPRDARRATHRTVARRAAGRRDRGVAPGHRRRPAGLGGRR